MATANLVSEKTKIDTTNDSVVIVNHIEGIPGGRTLDVEDFPDRELSAGHVIIKDAKSGNICPLQTTSGLTRRAYLRGYFSRLIAHG